MIKSALWTEFYLYFVNYKSNGMNITDYVVTVFKYEMKTATDCSWKTALYSVLINEMPCTTFS
jgi:hypothetical protein